MAEDMEEWQIPLMSAFSDIIANQYGSTLKKRQVAIN